MGTPLTGLQIGSTYNGLLKTTDNAVVNGTLRLISDGLGNDTALSVSTAGIKSSGTLEVTGVATLTAQPILSSLTASAAVATDASKGLVSVTNTGTGNNVLATSPTLVTPILGTPASGNLANCTGYVGTSALVTTGALNSGSITSGFGSIDIGADSLTAGAGSFTTLGASGLISMTAAASSVADNASGTYSRWRHNGANRLIIGTANQVYSGGSSADAAIFEESGSGSLRLGVGSTNSVTVSSTGLSCTGTLSASGLVSVGGSTPASASAAGVAGTITWDSSYIYVCTATNTWKRVAIATW